MVYLLNVENIDIYKLKENIWSLLCVDHMCGPCVDDVNLSLASEASSYQVPSQNEPEAFSTFDNSAIDNFD